MLLGRLLGLEMMRNNVTRALVRQSVLEAKKNDRTSTDAEPFGYHCVCFYRLCGV
jgi:hypothetical protein